MNDLKKGLASFVKGRNFSPTVVTALLIAIFVVANALVYVLYSYFSTGESTVAQEDLSITEISEKLNFSSIYSFSRAFSNFYGRSPSEFRNETKKKA